MPSPQITRLRIRMGVESSSKDPIKDTLTGATPQIWAGNSVQFEVGILRKNIIVDPSNLALLRLEVKATQVSTSDPLMAKTVTSGGIDATVDAVSWADETKQHALIAFTGTETNLDLSGKSSASYWLVISAVTTDGDPITLGVSTLTILQDNAGSEGSPPSNPPIYYTKAEIDAVFLPKASVNASFRFKEVVIEGVTYLYLEFFNPTQSKWHVIGVTGAEGQEQTTIAEGEV